MILNDLNPEQVNIALFELEDKINNILLKLSELDSNNTQDLSNIQNQIDTINASSKVYTAGTNININSNNVISAVDTTYSAGTGLTLSGTTFSQTVPTPTNTSDLTNDSGFITKSVNNLDNYTKSSDLATVATSGDYNDLINKPPAVNNGTLTIKQNGTTLGTFTANQSTNTEVNITGGGSGNVSYTDTSNITCNSGANSFTYIMQSGRTLLGANLVKVSSSGGSSATQISNFGWTIVNLDTTSTNTPMSQKITFNWNYSYLGGNHTVKIRIYYI